MKLIDKLVREKILELWLKGNTDQQIEDKIYEFLDSLKGSCLKTTDVQNARDSDIRAIIDEMKKTDNSILVKKEVDLKRNKVFDEHDLEYVGMVFKLKKESIVSINKFVERVRHSDFAKILEDQQYIWISHWMTIPNVLHGIASKLSDELEGWMKDK